jgi:hypothetical protein
LYQRSKPDFRVYVTLATQGVVWINIITVPSSCNVIKTFDFSTLYRTIPHSKLKYSLKKLVNMFFIKEKKGQRRYKYLRKGHILFCKKPPWFYKKVLLTWYHPNAFYSSFVMFDGLIFSTDSKHPMSTVCDSLLVNLFLYSYVSDFIQGNRWWHFTKRF